jgi:hypothetical protein
VLLRVGLEPEAVRTAADGRARLGPVARRLAERALLTVGPGELRDLNAAMAESDHVELKQLLATLLHARPLSDPGTETVPLGDVLCAEDVTTWRGVADLLLLSADRADLLADADSDPEIATLATAMNSTAMDSIDARWHHSAPAGTRREDVWRNHFEPLTRRRCDVFIIDRHAGGQLLAALEGSREDQLRDGAMWFLRRLASTGVQQVHLASSIREVPGRLQDRAHEMISAWFARQQPRSPLDLAMVPGDFAHQRRFAFDGWCGFEPHKGLASFDGSTLREDVDLDASLARAVRVRELYRGLRGQSAAIDSA